MGEAASSGLVTLTSDIAAVPEFFAHRDDALLAPPENFIALADFIEELYFDQELFERLSKAGSAKMKAK
ncbi:glycosyltransferase, partial [Escherichia coli]|uniref:glycosyltransferase n=1 Tax=Escherichia coli TaxID=562 RepID=UPI0020202721